MPSLTIKELEDKYKDLTKEFYNYEKLTKNPSPKDPNAPRYYHLWTKYTGQVSIAKRRNINLMKLYEEPADDTELRKLYWPKNCVERLIRHIHANFIDFQSSSAVRSIVFKEIAADCRGFIPNLSSKQVEVKYNELINKFNLYEKELMERFDTFGEGDSEDEIELKSPPFYDYWLKFSGRAPMSRNQYSDKINLNPEGSYLLVKRDTHCHSILEELMKDDKYADVVLTASNGNSIRAHKMVLCLASKYFRQVLGRNSNLGNCQSVVIMRDIHFKELQDIIKFIYTGEVTVNAAEMESFINTAKLLGITSLSDAPADLTERFLSPQKSDVNFILPKKRKSQQKKTKNEKKRIKSDFNHDDDPDYVAPTSKVRKHEDLPKIKDTKLTKVSLSQLFSLMKIHFNIFIKKVIKNQLINKFYL